MPTQVIDLLTGEAAGALLQSALTGLQQGRLPGFGHQVEQVQSRPGAETSVSYRVWYQVQDDQVTDHLVATTAPVASAVQVAAGDQTISIWRHPDDPELPGLANACNPDWLDAAVGASTTTSRLRVYRPLRRAVIEFTAGQAPHDHTWFAKVVRPDKLAGLETRLRLFAEAGIGPEVAHSDPSGVLVLAQAPGQPFAEHLSAAQRGVTSSTPDAIDLLDALDRLPTDLMRLPTEPPWTDRTEFHAQLATQALPDHAEQIDKLAILITELADRFPTGELVPTHGDAYEANIFWDDPEVTFIDVDRAGPGYRVDDLACVLAHLAVLPQLSPVHYPRGNEQLENWHREFAKRVDPGALAVRVAGVLLSLVGGAPRETALHRLDLVRNWLLRAQLRH